MSDAKDWVFGWGGWDGDAEAVCTRCRTEIPFTSGLTVAALVEQIEAHTCEPT